MDAYGLHRRGIIAVRGSPERPGGWGGAMAGLYHSREAITTGLGAVGAAIQASRMSGASAAGGFRVIPKAVFRTYGTGTAKRRQMYGGMKRRRSGTRSVVAGSMKYTRPKAMRDYPLYAAVRPGPPEMKNLAWSINFKFSTTPADGVPFLLNGCPQSDAITDRTTNRIRMHAVMFHYHILMGSDIAHGIAQPVDLALVYDRQTNGVLPGILDIFESQHSLSFQLREYRSRFQMVWRDTYQLIGHPSTAIYTSKTHVSGDIKIPLNREVVYADEFSLIDSIRSGSLYMIAMGTSPNTGAGTVPEGFVELRVLFSDL